jgi:hypothetical protein
MGAGVVRSEQPPPRNAEPDVWTFCDPDKLNLLS